MYLLVLIGSIVILFYFITLAGGILETQGLLPPTLSSVLDVFEYIYGFITDGVISVATYLWSFFI